jgi:hypothetical protein
MRRSVIVPSVATFLVLALGWAASPARADGPEVTAPAADAADRAKWGDHMGDLPFVVGYEKGMKQAAASGRQPMYFFTATW